MEIKKAGKVWSKIVKCNGENKKKVNREEGKVPCGAKLKISADDIFMTYGIYPGGRKGYFYTIQCPCCGSYTDLKYRQLPYAVRKSAIERDIDNFNAWFDLDDDYEDEI